MSAPAHPHTSSSSPPTGRLVFAACSWIPIPVAWGLLLAGLGDDVLDMNVTLVSVGLLVGAVGIVTAIAGLVVGVRSASRPHPPRQRGLIGLGVAGNALALVSVVAPFAVAAYGGSGPGTPLGDLGGTSRRPVAVRPAPLAPKLMVPGTGFVWSGGRPSAVPWPDGDLVASTGRNSLARMTPDGVVVWKRILVHRLGVHGCVVRGIAVAGKAAVASCGAIVVCVDEGGRDRWTRLFPGYLIDGLVAGADGLVYAYAEPTASLVDPGSGTQASTVMALAPGGDIRWTRRIDVLAGIPRDHGEFETTIDAGAAASGGGLIVATDGDVVSVSPDGKRRWRVSAGAREVEVSALVVGHDGTIYVAGKAGIPGFVQALYADGSPRWIAPASPVVTAAAIAPDGSLYALTQNHLYQFATT